MKKRTKAARIVPSLVMTATFATVIPSCGGTTDAQDGGSDAKNDIMMNGVADVGFIPPDASDAPNDASEGG